MIPEQQGKDQVTYRVDPQRTAWREMDGEGVVLNLETSVYFGLNRTAGVLWPRLIEGATHQELTQVLLGAAPAAVTRAQAEKESSQFLDVLDTERMLCS